MAVFIPINGKKVNNIRRTYKTLGSVKRLINYILNPEKTSVPLTGGIYCNPSTAYDEFVLTKALYGKLPTTIVSNSNQVFHFVQSYDVEELTPATARKIAEELLNCELFKGFQILYAVHTDKEHVHTHFAINSVNYENGLRWHISSYDLKKIQDYSDELCRKYNLSVIQRVAQRPKKNNSIHNSMSSGEYRAIKEGRSWKLEALQAGMAVKKVAKDKREFIELMESLGYKVRWEDSRKDISYTCPEGKKINSDKLGFLKRNFLPLTKESLEKQFAINRQIDINKNTTLLKEQNQLHNQILKLARNLNYQDNPYPFQSNLRLQRNRLNGQALKDKMLEAEKGQGIDWEV